MKKLAFFAVKKFSDQDKSPNLLCEIALGSTVWGLSSSMDETQKCQATAKKLYCQESAHYNTAVNDKSQDEQHYCPSEPVV